MACHHPLSAWRTKHGEITFKGGVGVGLAIHLPCGRCLGCRLEKSRQWAVRCLHEASLYDDNCFITLTYSDEFLPHDLSLRKDHFQKFMKRLRRANPGRVIRYYQCGEYGDENQRPHYHALIFNFDFSDKQLWSEQREQKIYVSEQLTNLWSMGFATCGSVTFDSAAYVSRYIIKKQVGKNASQHYERFDSLTGEIFNLLPEYSTMSLKPGIGRGFYDAYRSDIFPADSIVVRGREVGNTRFYRKLCEAQNPAEAEIYRTRRIKSASRNKADNTPERLAVREKCLIARTSNLKRKI